MYFRAAVALGATAAFFLVPAAAQAESFELTGGHLNWGVKQSFREYIEADPADGAIRLSGGAFRVAGGGIRFPVDHEDGGAYDTDTDLGEVKMRGTVRFTRHQTAPGSGIYSLDLTIAALRLQIDGNEGMLVADVTSKSLDSGESEQLDDLELAAVDLTDAGPTAGPERFIWGTSQAVLTEEGAPVFGGFYSAGASLDPISLTASYGEPSLPPTAPVLTTDPLSPANENNPRIKGTAPAGTTVRIYQGASCTGAPIASGTSAELAGAGLTVTVPDNSTREFTAWAEGEDSASDCSVAISYTEVTPSPPTPYPNGNDRKDPPPPGGGTSNSGWLAWKPLKGPRTVNRKRSVKIVKLTCWRGPCLISAPRAVNVKIAGKKFKAKVVAPKRITLRKSGWITLKLSRKAFVRLAGRQVKVKLKVAVRSGGQKISRTTRVTIRGKRR